MDSGIGSQRRWLLLAGVLLVLAGTKSVEGSCELLWSNQNGYCYFVNTQNQSWVAARQWCIAHNADLVSIMSPAENTMVANFARGLVRSPSYWIGLNDRQSQGQYSWSGGQALGYHNWRSGEPNNPVDEDCAEMDDSGYWNDQGCSVQQAFVCKKSASTSNPTFSFPGKYAIATDASCGGWYLNKGLCYQYFATLSVWSDAQKSCFAQGGYLLDIISSDELGYIKALVYNTTSKIGNFFIGLNDRLNESTYVWDDGTLQGHPLTVTNWAYGEPNNAHNLEDCVEFQNYPASKWNDMSCTSRRPYMCKRVASARNASGYWPAIARPAATACPRGYSTFHHPNGAVYCYGLKGMISAGRLQWVAAQKACSRAGPGFDLVSIHDHNEMNEIKNLITAAYPKFSTTTYWIGLNDRSREGGFVYSDGSATNYINWGSGQPNNLYRNQDCVSIYSAFYGSWNDDGCSTRHAYICKMTIKPAPLPSGGLPLVSDKYCLAGWHQFGSFCYLVKTTSSDLVSHSQAVGNCSTTYQSNLTSVHSMADHGFLMSIIGLHNTSARVHIGVNDIKVEGEFHWTDNTPVDFTNWGWNQPNDWRNTQDCTELDHNLGYWNDINCKNVKQRGYVCKRLRDQATAPPAQTSQCLTGWQWFNNYCYKIPNMNATAPSAQAYCNTQTNLNGLHGSLATIRSRYDNFFITSLIGSQSPAQRAYFIGMNDRNTEGMYTWWSGLPITYANWAKNEPNDWHHTEDCVEIYSKNYQWNDRICNRSQGFICMVPDNKQISLPTVKPPVYGSASASCPTGWLKHGATHMCYGFFGSIHPLTIKLQGALIAPKTWVDANVQCQTMGAQLVSIHDSDTNAFLMNTTQQYNMGWSSFWTGLNDRSQEGGYSWSDSSTLQFTAWATIEPNDWRGTEDCVEVFVGKARAGFQYHWNDQGCSSKRSYVCAFPAGAGYTTPTPAPYKFPPGVGTRPTCPTGWSAGSTNCYMVVTSRKQTWTQADLKCQSLAASLKLTAPMRPHLASIHTPSDHVELANLTSQACTAAGLPLNSTNFWIGLQDRYQENNFTWSDGSAIDYTAWSQSQPNDWSNSQDCVEMRLDQGFLWNDLACSTSQNYVCSFSRFIMHTTPVLPPAAQIESCDPNWKKYGLSCYHMYTVRMDYDNAYINCTRHGGDLYIANSKKEDQFVLGNVASGSAYVWIGLSDYDREGYYRWADGSYLSYTNWGPNQPNNYNNEDCVALHAEDDKWYDRSCDEPHAFVCEVPLFSMNYTYFQNNTSPTGSSHAAQTGSGAQNKPNSHYHVSKGLSGGAVAGIVIAVVVFIGIMGAVTYFGDFTKGCKGLPSRPSGHFSPSASSEGDDDDDDDAMLVAE